MFVYCDPDSFPSVFVSSSIHHAISAIACLGKTSRFTRFGHRMHRYQSLFHERR